MEKNKYDIILSSRIRIARNIEGVPFRNKISQTDAAAIEKNIYNSLAGSDNYNLLRMSETDVVDGNVLKEKHLISDDLLRNKKNGAVILNDAETISIMINEEDHIREQCILKSDSLKEAYECINAVDDIIAKKVTFSYDEKLGFLTACPTNLGTGMRASVMMFLPGLSIYNSLEACINAIARLNMTIRGVFGEGSVGEGYIYQISNQKSLGLSEQEIIDAVQTSIGHIVEAEYRARDMLLKNSYDEIRDKIARAYGVLTSCYKIDTKEFMQLFALIKLGLYYDFIKVSDRERFEKLATSCQPSHLLSIASKDITEKERDILRANYVSKTLNAITKINNQK